MNPENLFPRSPTLPTLPTPNNATMGLEDFERELAASKSKESRKESHKKRDRSRSRDRHREHRHKHHHSSRHDDHRHKRSKHHRETSEERSHRKRHERERERDEDRGGRSRRKEKDRRSPSPSSDEDRLTSKRKSRNAMYEEDSPSDDEPMDRDYAPPADDFLDHQLEAAADADLQRDDWMRAPAAMEVDYVQRKKKEDKSTFVGASAEQKHALKVHQAELNHHLKDLEEDSAPVEEEPERRDVSYKFGDSGSQWRMTKLKGVYRIAEQENRPVEEVALEKYGDLRDFDDAREEEVEVDRRNTYGRDYVGKEKPSGEFWEERKLKAGIHRPPREPAQLNEDLPQGEIVADPRPTANTVVLSQTELNKLKAQMMKAKMKGAANAAELEAQYNAAVSGAANRLEPDVVVLNSMDNRMLAGGREGEVKQLTNKRGQERGLVVENDDMSIEDMLRQERRTRGQAGGEGKLLAEKIAKDSKFDVSPISPPSIHPISLHPANPLPRTTSTTSTKTPKNSPPAPPNPQSTSATKPSPTTNAQTASSTPAPSATTKTSPRPNPRSPPSSPSPPASSSPSPQSPNSPTAAQS